jgi:hypothetical protein
MGVLTSNSFFKTRTRVHAGAFAAGTLGELQDVHRSAKRLARRVCKMHRWRNAKYSRTCTRCGLEEDRLPGS